MLDDELPASGARRAMDGILNRRGTPGKQKVGNVRSLLSV
jgi:hypothetical protein